MSEELDSVTARGLIGLVAARIAEEWFGEAFPFSCQDGHGNAGTDTQKLKTMMAAYGVVWPEDFEREEDLPEDGSVFDLIEFAYEHVAEPKSHGVHSYWGHSHYSYEQEAGRSRFEHEVNRLFERNGVAFELKHGEVARIAPTGLHEVLASTVFRTGDAALDQILEAAREKFLNRDLIVRRESLEKLWDAWERMKTIEAGKDKKAQALALLARASREPNFLARLEKEAVELTEIGNKFMIRHTETDKTPIGESNHVDYLFHRLFALIRLLLKASGRGG